MADITSLAVGDTTVGANYLKVAVTYPNATSTVASPFSTGTRDVTFYKVTGYSAVATGAGDANSTYSKILRGAQSVAEVFFASVPSANVVILGLATDLIEVGASEDQTNTRLQNANSVATLKAAIEAAAGGTATVSSSGVFQTS
jgi:hypothetical protein